MKKFSKIITVILMFSMLVLSLTGCGSDPTKDAEAAVSKNLDEVKNVSDETYNEYMQLLGLASLEIPEESTEQLKTFVKTILDNIDYKIVSSEKVDDNNVTVKTDITSINMKAIMEKFQQEVANLSSSEDIKNLSQEELTKKAFELLANTVNQSDLEKVTTTVDISVTKVDKEWQPTMDSEIINAIYGDMLNSEE